MTKTTIFIVALFGLMFGYMVGHNSGFNRGYELGQLVLGSKFCQYGVQCVEGVRK